MVLTLSKVITVEGLNGNHLLVHRQLSAPALGCFCGSSDCPSMSWVRQVGLQSGAFWPAVESSPLSFTLSVSSLSWPLCAASRTVTAKSEMKLPPFTFCPFLGHLGISVRSVALLVIVSMSVLKSKAVVSWQYYKDSDLNWYSFFSLDILTRPKTFSHRIRFRFPSVYSNEWGNLRVIFIWVFHTGPILQSVCRILFSALVIFCWYEPHFEKQLLLIQVILLLVCYNEQKALYKLINFSNWLVSKHNLEKEAQLSKIYFHFYLW